MPKITYEDLDRIGNENKKNNANAESTSASYLSGIAYALVDIREAIEKLTNATK